MIHTNGFERLVDQLREGRSQLQENALRVRHAAFTFQTGLQQVKRGISDSTAAFVELSNAPAYRPAAETIMPVLQRRAS